MILGVAFMLTFLLSCKNSPNPKPDFTFQENIAYTAPVDVAFQNTSKNGTSYKWDFGDGNTSTEASVTHKFTTPGNYTITLFTSNGSKEASVSKTIEIQTQYFVDLQTSLGTIKMMLYNTTPQHRDNFIKLSKEGYYDGLLFHRVIPGFMIQGGDPDSKTAAAGARLGSGGPGYRIPAEIGSYHYRGALAAARDGNPQRASSGSQFYIVTGAPVNDFLLSQIQNKEQIVYSQQEADYYKQVGGAPNLDNQYSVFGRVTEGIEIADAIVNANRDSNDRPLEDLKIISTKVYTQ